jgi:hypothetical protein
VPVRGPVMGGTGIDGVLGWRSDQDPRLWLHGPNDSHERQ